MSTSKRLSRTRVRGNMEARVTSVEITHESNESRQISETDQYLSITPGLGNVIIATPYDVATLFRMCDMSNTIQPAVDAYVTNVINPGWEVTACSTGTTVNASEAAEAQSFIDHANSQESLETVMAKVIRDREFVGFGFMEIIRDAVGRIALLRHAKSLITRIAIQHPESVLVTYNIARGNRISRVSEYRRFRRYLQVCGGRTVWFKEYGDPRKLNASTGLFEGEPGYEDGVPATEIYHFRLPSNDAYGVPRWVIQTPNVLGSRESEEGNLNYFRENTIPPLLMMVSGGRLTAQSYKDVVATMKGDRTRATSNRFALVEAVPEGDSVDGRGGNVSVSLEKLTDARQTDGLFSGYDQDNQQKILSSWRLPPSAIGRSKSGNFTGEAVASFVVESQVYSPARTDIDEILNKMFVSNERGLNLRTVILTSRTPAITNPEMVVRTLTALNTIGAITPRQAQIIANTMMQIEIPLYPNIGEQGYEEWMDKPIQMTLRNSYNDHSGGVGDVIEGEQEGKDSRTKEVEATGNVGMRQPKNGEQINGV